MRRAGALLLLVYLSFAGAAVLCPAGVVVHDCPLDGAGACSHETDCPDDPCQVAHRPLASDRGTVAVAPAGPAVSAAVIPDEITVAPAPAVAAVVSTDVLVPPPPPLLC